MDLTSHELRNPLNAIWQSAELVEHSLTQMRELLNPMLAHNSAINESDRTEMHQALEEAEDAIESVSGLATCSTILTAVRLF